MPELTAILAAEQYRAALLAKERAAAVRLANAYGLIYQRLQARLEALDAEITGLMLGDGSVSMGRVTRLDQMQALRRQVLDEMSRFTALAENEMDQGTREAIAAALRDSERLVQAALPGVAEIDARLMASAWQRLDPAAVESMLGFLSEDSPLRQGLREQFGEALADQVEKGLIESVALGYNPRKLAKAFRDELGQGLTWALRLARTTQLNAYREATRASYLANPDIVKGWKWHSTRDSRVCMSCIAMDGTVHKPDERLNDHWNGRCDMIPMTVTYRDLGLDVDEPPDPDSYLSGRPRAEQERLLGKRYDDWKSGKLRFSESAATWFGRQPEAIQRKMMGPGKYAAWQAGQIDLSELSKVYNDPVWGAMRAETPLKDLIGEEGEAA